MESLKGISVCRCCCLRAPHLTGLHVLSVWANTFNSLAPICETWKTTWFLLPFLLHFFLCLPPFQPLTVWSPWGEAVVVWIMQSEYTFFSLNKLCLSSLTNADSSSCYCIHCLNRCWAIRTEFILILMVVNIHMPSVTLLRACPHIKSCWCYMPLVESNPPLLTLYRIGNSLWWSKLRL